GVAGIVLHVPGGELVAGDDRATFGAVEFGALRVAGPERSRGLHDAGRAAGEFQDGVHDIFALDLVQCAELPDAEDFLHGAGEPADDIDAVDRLVDERAAAFGLPASFDRARVGFGGAVPLDITICLQKLAYAAAGDRCGEEETRVIGAVLAPYVEQDAAARSRA